MHTNSSGGSQDTEVKLLTVSPRNPSSVLAATTATEPAARPAARRNLSPSTTSLADSSTGILASEYSNTRNVTAQTGSDLLTVPRRGRSLRSAHLEATD